jgi:hypothetical protein
VLRDTIKWTFFIYEGERFKKVNLKYNSMLKSVSMWKGRSEYYTGMRQKLDIQYTLNAALSRDLSR